MAEEREKTSHKGHPVAAGSTVHAGVKLPPRQQDVLRRFLRGDCEKQVARALGISIHTVHVYAKMLYRHFGVDSRASLLARFIPQGEPEWLFDRQRPEVTPDSPPIIEWGRPTSNDLAGEQASSHLAPLVETLQYLQRLECRMGERGFSADDPLWTKATLAQQALSELRLALHELETRSTREQPAKPTGRTRSGYGSAIPSPAK